MGLVDYGSLTYRENLFSCCLPPLTGVSGRSFPNRPLRRGTRSEVNLSVEGASHKE